MDLQEIEAIIERDGTVRIQVRGVKGPACLDITRPLEEALGGAIVSRELGPEAGESAAAIDRIRRERRGGA